MANVIGEFVEGLRKRETELWSELEEITGVLDKLAPDRPKVRAAESKVPVGPVVQTTGFAVPEGGVEVKKPPPQKELNLKNSKVVVWDPYKRFWNFDFNEEGLPVSHQHDTTTGLLGITRSHNDRAGQTYYVRDHTRSPRYEQTRGGLWIGKFTTLDEAKAALLASIHGTFRGWKEWSLRPLMDRTFEFQKKMAVLYPLEKN